MENNASQPSGAQPHVFIPARFNGPPTSGNGGYSCGVLAAFIDGAAKVRLHAPPPLDTPLRVADAGDGVRQMYDGDALIGSAFPTDLELEIPPAPSVAQAKAAMERFPLYEGHVFGTCFVCGPDRPDHDGLCLFTGVVEERGDVLASNWEPASDLLDDAGNVRPEILWSALDCPGYFAIMGDTPIAAMLGELSAELYDTVPGDQSLVVYAWPLGREGRKYHAGAAVATGDGRVVAASRSTWIELQAPPGAN
ncbi:MAG: hypothetical protein ACPG1A_11070 [Halioglobus sp.]